MKPKPEAVERVVRLAHWDSDHTLEIAESNLLVKEHLRRLWHWLEYLDPPVRWPRWPGVFVSGLAEIVIGKTEAQQLQDEIRALVYPTGKHMLESITLMRFLQWSALDGHPRVISSKLPDPYEPLLQIYEAGIMIHFENNVLLVCHPDCGDFAVSRDRDEYARLEPFI